MKVPSSLKWLAVGLAVALLLTGGCSASPNNGEQNNRPVGSPTATPASTADATPVEEVPATVTPAPAATIEDLTEIWATALKTRDGKTRYDMMSDQAKQKFVKEQQARGGKDWNYNIGVSSPWVVSYESTIEGNHVTITYLTETSGPSYYNTVESLTFAEENGKFVVDDYQTVYEGKLLDKQADK
ncbi:hypothetical protein [Paenibacillus glycanilyticus]|uniref:DUF4019 domain-containing protein n=1 Tax=Paenibacillus glycanilyticus TaxID=126569 RepID=A0ABQ6GGC6_9BACL|nr:hypothetical protein [Paenibacillus glycanilyticus]GLX69278.1 hypothetical protein MU1_36230 [Paenibacillus glycanilyticus]